jgi:hypothetical protein
VSEVANSQLKKRFNEDPDTKEFSTGLVSAEWVLDQIDIAMNHHNHNDKNSSQLAALSVTAEKLANSLDLRGKTILIDTPDI